MQYLSTSAWALMIGATVPWLLLTLWYMTKVKRVDKARRRSSTLSEVPPHLVPENYDCKPG